MSPQVHFPLETFPAQVAAERFEACVLSAVRDEVGALTEGLPAYLALVRLLTCNINKKTRQLRHVRRGKYTVYLSVSTVSLTCVDESVFFHI